MIKRMDIIKTYKNNPSKQLSLNHQKYKPEFA
jgi:hypothetical protein